MHLTRVLCVVAVVANVDIVKRLVKTETPKMVSLNLPEVVDGRHTRQSLSNQKHVQSEKLNYNALIQTANH